MLGLSAEGLGAEQQRRGLKRALDGARRELRAVLAQRIENTFSPQGPMAQELDAFLRGGLERYLAERPMPEALAEAELGAALIDHALERFNQDWLQERATVREQELGRLRTDLGETLATATAALGQELQSLLPRALRATLDQLFDADQIRSAHQLERLKVRKYEQYRHLLEEPYLLLPVRLRFCSLRVAL